MYESPTAQRPMQQQLSDLRMQQYAALDSHPIDWETVGRLGQRILTLEIHRRRSLSTGHTQSLNRSQMQR